MSIPRDCEHHATMLADTVRLNAYQEAINEIVQASDTVVDIGAGTGVLSAMASRRTFAEVTALEYFEDTAATAKLLIDASKIPNLNVVAKASYEFKMPADPQVLVTETIGAIGPEENIVELCYHFKKRHPEIRNIIPATLSLKAQAVNSSVLDNQQSHFLDSFLNVEVGTFNYRPLRESLLNFFYNKIHCTVDANAKLLGNEQMLTQYDLGITSRSDFTTTIQVSDEDANAVHLYFEAALSPQVVLSSKLNSPLTHWKHCFIPRPPTKNTLQLSYVAAQKTWSLIWS